MSRETHHKRRDVIAEEAASYLVELESPEVDTNAKLAAWLRTSPEHVEEFLAVAELWGALPGVAEQPTIDELVALAGGEPNIIDLGSVIDRTKAGGSSKVHPTNSAALDFQASDSSERTETKESASSPIAVSEGPPGSAALVGRTASHEQELTNRSTSENPVQLPVDDSVPSSVNDSVQLPVKEPVPERSRLRTWTLGLATAATIATIAIVAALQLLPETPDPNTYTTAIGEQTSLPLPDGSLVTLNTQSTLRVAYSDQFRDIHLTAGEALFDVTKDPDRPFRVITEHAVVTAVGTQFNVRNVADDVVVTVVKGIVDVVTASPGNSGSNVPSSATTPPAQPARLTVGQQARVAAGEVAVIDTVVDRATAWKERRLVFESLTLEEVIDEFNRYNDPPLLIDDPALRELPISGVFRANDRASFVEFLDTMNLAQSQTRADGTIVLRGLDNP